MATLVAATVAGCGSSTVSQNTAVVVGTIGINGGSLSIERGFHTTLTATVLNPAGQTMSVPVAWHSIDDKIATVNANGVLTAVDTGLTFVVASSLGVNSPAIQVRVVWQGAASIAQSNFIAPPAASPGALVDSIKVFVADLKGKPVPALVKFAVTAGGGTVSPVYVITNQLGIAAAQWTLGNSLGINTVTATVVGQDSLPYAFVTPNTTTFSVRTFAALVPVSGDGQTGLILSPLPVTPSVRVVDSTGKPRLGVPVTFAATAGGRVVSTTVSTGADGSASPGVWTLGDIPGDQQLIATSGKATITLHATGTGTPIHFASKQVATAGGASCALVTGATATCWGAEPNVGDSALVNKTVPTPTKSAIQFVSLAGSHSTTSHFCGVTTTQGIACWGVNALVDTSGKVLTKQVPTLLPNATSWKAVAPGSQHNCALATDGSVQCWGDNSAGQLGDRTTTVRFVPAPVYGGFQFTSVSSGTAHVCGVAADGSAFCWGLNTNGQIGDGTTTNRLSPTAVGGGLTFQSVGAGAAWTCGLTTTGKVYCWGNLLVAGSTVVTSPRALTATPAFTQMSIGGVHGCALTSDGTAYCWGSNSVGEVGDSSLVDRPNPVPVATSLKFTSITAGYNHTCATTQDGSVACWGDNSVGELADSTAILRIQPRFIVTGVTP